MKPAIITLAILAAVFSGVEGWLLSHQSYIPPLPQPVASETCGVSISDPRFLCYCRVTVPGHMQADCENVEAPTMDPDDTPQGKP